MQNIGCSPGTVPYGADETLYVVVDRFFSGSACRVTESEKADLETVLSELLSGQYNCPVRVVAFNTLEHWSDDVSADVASEIEMRCDIDGLPVPDELHDFVKENTRLKRPSGFQSVSAGKVKHLTDFISDRISITVPQQMDATNGN